MQPIWDPSCGNSLQMTLKYLVASQYLSTKVGFN